MPSSSPSNVPSSAPSNVPSSGPSDAPSSAPSVVPSPTPSNVPSSAPSDVPSSSPSDAPSSAPSVMPSSSPSNVPSSAPSDVPSSSPSDAPSSVPSAKPSNNPTFTPTESPSFLPSPLPSASPSSLPSFDPSNKPSSNPSTSPSSVPSSVPSLNPSSSPSLEPSNNPSALPSSEPSPSPTSEPSMLPSAFPSERPSNAPSFYPSSAPSYSPSVSPQPSSAPTPSPVDCSLLQFKYLCNMAEEAFGCAWQGSPWYGSCFNERAGGPGCPSLGYGQCQILPFCEWESNGWDWNNGNIGTSEDTNHHWNGACVTLDEPSVPTAAPTPSPVDCGILTNKRMCKNAWDAFGCWWSEDSESCVNQRGGGGGCPSLREYACEYFPYCGWNDEEDFGWGDNNGDDDGICETLDEPVFNKCASDSCSGCLQRKKCRSVGCQWRNGKCK